MKTPTRPRRRSAELQRADSRRVDLSTFKHDLSPERLAELGIRTLDRLRLNALFGSVETLSPTRTVGRGRTNLTIIEPTLVQIDATVPHARFDMTASPRRRPALQMHFQAAPYGITAPATYFMIFAVEVTGSATFALDGVHGPGGISNPGTRVLSGRTTVTLVFKDVAPAQELYGYIEQQSGTAWTWFSTQVTFPPLVISL